MSLWERSRFIIGADSYFARVGLAPSDAAPVPIADHASHDNPDDPGRGHEYDEALAEAVPSTQPNSNGWGYIVDADDGSFQLGVSPYGVEDVPSAAGNALMSDLASVSDFSPRFFGGDCVALCQSTGNSTGVDDNGTHADQLLVFDVLGRSRHTRRSFGNGGCIMTDALFGIDYRDSAGALAHVTPADIKSFQGGASFVIEYIGVAAGQGNNALTAANASALESAGLSIVSVYENRPLSGGGMSDRTLMALHERLG